MGHFIFSLSGPKRTYEYFSEALRGQPRRYVSSVQYSTTPAPSYRLTPKEIEHRNTVPKPQTAKDKNGFWGLGLRVLGLRALGF